MSGVADYGGVRITGDEDIEGRHLEMCAIYKKRLEKVETGRAKISPLLNYMSSLKI